VDTLLKGYAARGLRMLYGLKGEWLSSPVVLCALSREIRQLACMSSEIEQGSSTDRVMGAYRIWDKRKPLVRHGLKLRATHWRRLLMLCAQVDRTIKGMGDGDPWQLMQDVAVGISGRKLR